MKIDEYTKLCKTNDDLLKSNRSNLYTVAISNLHVRRYHPEEIKLLKPRINEFIKKFLFKLKSFFLNIFFEKKDFYYNKKSQNLSIHDCLIISNLINDNEENIFKDKYFGNLENDLKKINVKTITAFKNFSNFSNFKLFKKIKKNNKKLIILSKRLSLLSELNLILITIFEILRNIIIKNKINITYFFSIPSNLRISNQIEKIIKKINPKIIIFTFEGHSWERILIKKIKNYNSNIFCAGYQFGLLTKNHHSIFRKLKKNYNPDFIFTSGKITQKIFEENSNYSNTIISILGSYKRDTNNFLSNNKNINKKTFLVVPEGIETLKFFKFIVECAKMFNFYNFIFKVHPEVEINLIKYLENKIKENGIINIRISTSKIDILEEIMISKFIIYRGSIGVFQGCLNDLIPIYYNAKEIIDINPLYKFIHSDLIINIPEDLEIFKNSSKFDNKIKYYKQISKDYFEVIKPRIIKDIIFK